jgi:hypothetical protein
VPPVVSAAEAAALRAATVLRGADLGLYMADLGVLFTRRERAVNKELNDWPEVYDAGMGTPLPASVDGGVTFTADDFFGWLEDEAMWRPPFNFPGGVVTPGPDEEVCTAARFELPASILDGQAVGSNGVDTQVRAALTRSHCI